MARSLTFGSKAGLPRQIIRRSTAHPRRSRGRVQAAQLQSARVARGRKHL